jgi:metallo-beta-lactamase family protein
MDMLFLGAAGEVTGSCCRVGHQGGAFLVDCGLFQGGRDAERKNRAALAFDLAAIDCVLLTHAHLDHSGLLPRLVALGYRGPIYATRATVDLLGVMLLDSAHIQEKEAEWLTRQSHRVRRRRARELAPLYTVEQARQSLRHLRAVDYDENLHLPGALSVRFRDAGHILGSAILEVSLTENGRVHQLVFSGDLGQPERPVLRDPAFVASADVLCVESTYGDRAHRTLKETEDELVSAVTDTLVDRGGNVIIPAFAVGRTQEVLFMLADLVRRGRLEPLDVVVDSPMASAATDVTLRHRELWDQPTRELLDWQAAHPREIRVRFTEDVEESMALNARRGGLVIISASGMCEAGRIKHHLRYNLGRPECAVLITGFQAAGTLGRRLVDGARQVTLFGERIVVKAAIHTIGGLSAHADRPALLSWLTHFQKPPGRTFVVHGERQASASLAEAIAGELGWPQVALPEPGFPYHLHWIERASRGFA